MNGKKYYNQYIMWRRHLQYSHPNLFNAIKFFRTSNTVYSLTIITICLMLFVIAIKINSLNPNIIPFYEIRQLQSNLLTASSIIISLTIAFVISKYFDIQKFRTSELNKFINLQNKIVQYQRAFDQLGAQLERKYQLNPKYPLDHIKALNDLDYSWNKVDRSLKPDACIFTSAFRQFGARYWEYDDFDLKRKIMPKSLLKKLEICATNLFGMLDREKNYKYILEDLGINQTLNFSDIKIAQYTYLVKEEAMQISPKKERDSWENLDFWRDRIYEANTIVDKMLKISLYLHDYKAKLLRRYLRFLLMSSIFGIILPLLLLSLTFSEGFEYYLTYVSIGGFLLSFILILALIYSELTSIDIQRL